jgi:hypothetical protein
MLYTRLSGHVERKSLNIYQNEKCSEQKVFKELRHAFYFG